MSTETLETTSPAPAKSSPGLEYLLNSGVVKVLTTKIKVFEGERISECCGSSVYPNADKYCTPWFRYALPKNPKYEKYHSFDGTRAHALQLMEEMEKDTEYHADYFKEHRSPSPFQLEYWVPYQPVGTADPEKAALVHYTMWKMGQARDATPTRDKAQVVFDYRPIEEAKQWWFPSRTWDGVRDGIEIDDPDVGKHCLLWVNA